MKKNKIFLIIIIFFQFNCLLADDNNFNIWLIKFNKFALNEGISQNTIDIVMKDAKFLPKVIEYDRYQPEFYEDTKTYIKKIASKKKLEKGKNLYELNKKLILEIDNTFNVEITYLIN